MAFGTRQQNDFGDRQTCGAIEEPAVFHIPTLVENDFGITVRRDHLGNLHRQVYFGHAVGESDVRPVKQCRETA